MKINVTSLKCDRKFILTRGFKKIWNKINLSVNFDLLFLSFPFLGNAHVIICNGDRTEWSTIQGPLVRSPIKLILG